jgi:hypothetical protein
LTLTSEPMRDKNRSLGCSSETLVDFQRTTRRYIPPLWEPQILHPHKCSSHNVQIKFHNHTNYLQWAHYTNERMTWVRNMYELPTVPNHCCISSLNWVFLFSLLPLFWKNRVGLWDHVVCVCVCGPLLTYECLNQSVLNLVRISRHLNPSQRPKKSLPSVCVSL